MPLYDYVCADCGKKFELSLTLSERESPSEKKVCPSCASRNIEQKLSFSGGILSGARTAAEDRPPCMAGGCCPGSSCPWDDSD